MVLCDTGPIVAILERRDAAHAKCVTALDSFAGPLCTTWLCVTEAMHLLHRESGWLGQKLLWDVIQRGDLIVDRLDDIMDERIMNDQMAAYQDFPMDVADASLVVLADRLGTRRIFTIDTHFYAFRALDGSPFDVVPGR